MSLVIMSSLRLVTSKTVVAPLLDGALSTDPFTGTLNQRRDAFLINLAKIYLPTATVKEFRRCLASNSGSFTNLFVAFPAHSTLAKIVQSKTD